MIFSGCLTSANYNMTADILVQTVVQDQKSKATTKLWEVDHQIRCYATSIVTDAVSDDSDGKDFRFAYSEWQFIKIRTGEKLGKRHRVSSIRDASGELIWTEMERNDAPTTFEVQGVTPRMDPFQNIIDYEVLLKRVEVQNGN
jgi:hypothetical protein